MTPIVLIMQSIINQGKILFLNSSVKNTPLPGGKIAKSRKGLKSMYQDEPIKFSISISSLTPHALWVPRML